MSKLYLPGFAVKSCTTVIARWSATRGIIRDLFRVGTFYVPTFFITNTYIIICANIIYLGGIILWQFLQVQE